MALDFREVESQYHGRLNEPSSDFIWGDFIDESICDELIHFYDTQDIIERKDGRIGRTGPEGDLDTDFKESVDIARTRSTCPCVKISVLNCEVRAHPSFIADRVSKC